MALPNFFHEFLPFWNRYHKHRGREGAQAVASGCYTARLQFFLLWLKNFNVVLFGFLEVSGVFFGFFWGFHVPSQKVKIQTSKLCENVRAKETWPHVCCEGVEKRISNSPTQDEVPNRTLFHKTSRLDPPKASASLPLLRKTMFCFTRFCFKKCTTARTDRKWYQGPAISDLCGRVVAALFASLRRGSHGCGRTPRTHDSLSLYRSPVVWTHSVIAIQCKEWFLFVMPHAQTRTMFFWSKEDTPKNKGGNLWVSPKNYPRKNLVV